MYSTQGVSIESIFQFGIYASFTFTAFIPFLPS